MRRPRLYTTSVERKAAWRRRQGMAVRPHYPSAPPSKRPIGRASGRPPRTWPPASVRRSSRRSRRGHWRISAGSCTRSSMTGAGTRTCHSVFRRAGPSGLLTGASASFYGVAAARVRQHRRALQRLAHVRATKGAHAGALAQRAQTAHRGVRLSPPQGPYGDPVRGTWRERPANVRCPLAQKQGCVIPHVCYPLPWKCKGRLPPFSGGFCVTHARRPLCPCLHTRSAHPCHADGRPARLRHQASLAGDACRRGDCLGRHSPGGRTDAGAGTARVPSRSEGATRGPVEAIRASGVGAAGGDVQGACVL